MASKKTSEENVLTKSGFNANTIMRLADGSTSDNYKTPVLDFINAITLTSAQAITLLGTPSDVVLDSMYKITTLSITGVDHVIISGREMISKGKCKVYATDVSGYIDGDYETSSNTLAAVIEQEFLIIDDGVTFTITAIKDDFVGKTYTVNYDVSSNTPYIVETALNTWDSAKTKIIGSSSTDGNGELLLSYGFYDTPKKLIIYPYNAFGMATSDKQKQHGMTFRVITTLS